MRKQAEDVLRDASSMLIFQSVLKTPTSQNFLRVVLQVAKGNDPAKAVQVRRASNTSLEHWRASAVRGQPRDTPTLRSATTSPSYVQPIKWNLAPNRIPREHTPPSSLASMTESTKGGPPRIARNQNYANVWEL